LVDRFHSSEYWCRECHSPGFSGLLFPAVAGHSQIDDELNPELLESLDGGGIRLGARYSRSSNLSKVQDSILRRQAALTALETEQMFIPKIKGAAEAKASCWL
jgi:hypothetical protein